MGYSIFKPDEEAPEEDNSLQAALSAQASKSFEHQGAAAHVRGGPKKSQESRSPKAESSDIAKLTQAVLNMKAEMSIMNRAVTNAGIKFRKFSQSAQAEGASRPWKVERQVCRGSQEELA